MSTSIVEEIRDKVRQLHKSKDDGDVRSRLGVTENGGLTLEQKVLLGALGLVLEVSREFDRKTAESVEISFGLRETLRDLEQGKSILLTENRPDGFQVEMTRLEKRRQITEEPLLCNWCCCRDGKPFCCLTYSLPDTSPAT